MTIQFTHGIGYAWGLQWEPFVSPKGEVYYNIDVFCQNFNLSAATFSQFMAHLSALLPIQKKLLDALHEPAQLTLNNGDKIRGITPENIIALLDTVARAANNKLLYASELIIGQQATVLLQSVTGSLLQQWGQAASGYSLYKQNHKRALAIFLEEETKRPIYQWIMAFPDDFFETLFPLFSWNWSLLNEQPEKIGQVIINIIFARLPQDTYEEILPRGPKKKYSKNGIPGVALPTHNLLVYLISLSNLVKIAKGNTDDFFNLLNQLYPVQHQYLVIPIKKKKQEINQEILPVFQLIKEVI